MTTLFTESDIGLVADQNVGDKLDYGLDWSDAIAKTPGDAISSSTWTAIEPGLTLSNSAHAGAVASVWIEGGTAGTWYTLQNVIMTTAGRRYTKICLLQVKQSVGAGSPLFPNRFVAIAKMRRDRLVVAASGALPSVNLSDDYIWDKLVAAESEVAHEIRVPLVPTAFFPNEPTADEITALAGMPWAIDPGYDYEPAAFGGGDKWGMLKLRQKPIKSVSLVRFAYPGGNGSHYDLPLDWLRMDRKGGVVQFVPSSTAFIAPLNNFVMQAIGNGRQIPLAIQISYVAGLENVSANYPELVDLVIKKASLKIIEDAYLPQSGSISADGLSQSISNDMDKHHDTIDRILYGAKGSNGGLMTAIHGIRLGVL